MKTFNQYLEESNINQLARKAKIDITNLDPKQLKMGIGVEREHKGKMGNDSQVISTDIEALKISVAHLREIPDYYTRLDKMEKQASRATHPMPLCTLVGRGCR